MEETTCNLCGSEESKLVFCSSDRLHGLPGKFNIVQCLNCDLLYLNPRPDRSEINLYYPDTYNAYVSWRTDRKSLKEYVAKKCWGKHPPKGIDKLLSALFKKRLMGMPDYVDRGKVLDIGCGNGYMVNLLNELGWDSFGLEMSEIAVRAAQEMGLKIQCGSIDDDVEYYPSGSFDAVLMLQVLEHLYDPLKVLIKVHKLLKPGGQLIVTTPNASGFMAKFWNARWRGWESPRHLNLFGRKTLGEILICAGFLNAEMLNFGRGSTLSYGLEYLISDILHRKIILGENPFLLRIGDVIMEIFSRVGLGDQLEARCRVPFN